MSGNTENPKSIHFGYENANDYRLVYSTGAQGGVMPNGLIKFDFYTEFHTSPSAEKRDLLEDGKLGQPLFEGLIPEVINVTRRREIGIIMSPSDAKSLAKWLQVKADESDKLYGLNLEKED